MINNNVNISPVFELKQKNNDKNTTGTENKNAVTENKVENKKVSTENKTENKNTVTENKTEEKTQQTSNLSKPDSAGGITNYNESKHEAKIVSFDSNSVNESEDFKPMNDVSKHMNDKDFSKVMEFVNKIKNDTTDAVLKSFDLMLQHARKMMEENQRYIKTTVIPKEQALKAQDLREGKQPQAFLH